MSWRRLRTLMRREVRATLRDPFTVGDPDRGAARRAARSSASCSRPRCKDLGARRARREPERREPPPGRRPRRARGASRRAPYRRRATRSSARCVGGDDQRRARHPARTSTARCATRPGGAPPRGPAPLRRRRDRARRQRRGVPARRSIGGERRAQLVRRRRARAAAPRGGVEVVDARALQPDARRHAVHGRRHLRLRALLPHHAHHRGVDRQRAPRRAPSSSSRSRRRRRSRSCSARSCRSAPCSRSTSSLMVLVAGLAARRLAARAARSSSSPSRRSTCSSRWRSASSSRRPRRPPPRRCRRPCCSASRSCSSAASPSRSATCRLAVQWLAELFPATHYIRVSRAHLPARRGAARRCCPSSRCSALFGVAARRARAAHASRRAHEPRAPLLLERPRGRLQGGARAAPRPGASSATVLVAADHDAAALRLRALEQAGATCRGRCSTAARTAASRRLVADDRSRPATSCRRSAVASYAEGARAAARAATRSRCVVDPARLPRATSSAAGPQVQLLLDGSDPLTAARVGGYVAPGRRALRAGRARAGAREPAAPRGADRRPPALLVQPDAARPRLLPRRARRHAAHQPLPLGVAASASSASARAAPTSRCSSLPTTPLEIVLGKLAARRRRQLRACSRSRSLRRGLVFGLWPRGQLARARRSSPCRSCSPRSRSASSSRRSRAPRRRRCSSRSSSSCRRSCSRA